jgi:hypothetical protein
MIVPTHKVKYNTAFLAAKRNAHGLVGLGLELFYALLPCL